MTKPTGKPVGRPKTYREATRAEFYLPADVNDELAKRARDAGLSRSQFLVQTLRKLWRLKSDEGR